MWNIIINRWKQGFRTLKYPKEDPGFSKRFRGIPLLNSEKNDIPVRKDKDLLGAVSEQGPAIDMGKLTFSENEKQIFPEGVFTYSKDFHLSASKREDLLVRPNESVPRSCDLDKKMKKLFGRSFKLRHVSAGGCGGCEAEISVIQIIVFDLYRFGISYVSSPRHADGLIVSGPVTKNMVTALKETYDSMPSPKIVIAAGACAISGGRFKGSDQVYDGVDGIIPVNLYIPGCPPHPITILDGLIRLLDKL